MFDPLFTGLAWLLNFFYVVSGQSYIGAIVLFTLAVMLALFPLTAKQTRSMVEMQRIQPEIRKLQTKFKDDRQALNEAMMGLYKEHGVNPLAGCLPLIVQMPVLLLLFNLLKGLTNTVSVDGREVFRPQHLDESMALYKALVGDTQMVEKGVDLARSAADVFKDNGLPDVLPYLLLVGLTIATGVYQQRQMTRRNPPQMTDNPQAAAMQRVMKIMPLMFGVFSWGFQAGLVVYFIVSNCFRIAQQSFLYRFDPVLREHSAQKREAAARHQGGSKQSRPKQAAGQKTKPAQTKQPPPKPEGTDPGTDPGTNGKEQKPKGQGGANRSRNKKKRKGR